MILRFFFLLFVSEASKTPKFKWAQDDSYIYLTVFAKCSDATKKLTISNASFRLECDVAILELTLRDDIDPTDSICEATRYSDSQLCTIKKQHSFIYDRLTESITELRQLKGFISIDYDRMGTVDIDDDDKNPYPSPKPLEINFKQTSVIEITDTNLKSMMENKLLFVFTSYPRCTYCKDFVSEFIRAKIAKTLEKKFPNVRFGYADAINNPTIRRQLGVKCERSRECNVTLFKSGLPYTINVDNMMETEHFETFFSSLLRPWSTDIDSIESLEEFVRLNDRSLVFFSKEIHPIEPKILFSIISSGASCGIVHDSNVMDDFPDNSIILFKKKLEKKVVFGGPLLPEAVDRFLMLENWELVEDWEWDETEKMEKLNLSCVLLFLGDGEKKDVRETNRELLDTVETVAQKFRGQIAFVLATKERMNQIFDWEISDVQLFAISEDFDHDSIFYQYEGDSFESTKFTQFCQDFLDKKLSVNLIIRKSEVSPSEPFQPGEIRKLVQKTWEREVTSNAETDILVMVSHAYGSNNKNDKWKTTLTTIASYLKYVQNTMVASYSLDNNYWDSELFPENIDMDKMGVWIWLFPSGRIQGSKPILYKKQRSLKKLLLWLKKKSSRVKAAWGAIKSSIKKAQEAIAEEKRLAEEKRKVAEEELDKLEKIDISGDGGIIKQIIHAGEGDSVPAKGAKVTAHYTGKLLNGEKFDSSVDNGQPFAFDLGTGNVIKCWDQAFATMKKKEKAMLTCREDYAYGSRAQGSIPAGATLKFEVELLWSSEWEPQTSDHKTEL